MLFATNVIHVHVALDEDDIGNPFTNSLRAAIIQANTDEMANPTDVNIIEFSNLSPIDALDRIDGRSELCAPLTAQNTIIDGTQSPQGRVVVAGNGFFVNPSNQIVRGTFNGLNIQAPNVTIKGLSFVNCGNSTMTPGAAITLDKNSTDDVIENCWFRISCIHGIGNGPNNIDIDVTNGTTGDTIGVAGTHRI